MKGCDFVDIPDEASPEAVARALLRLSIFASGRTAPNPPVACVISFPDRSVLIGGATEPAGGRHAEIVALDALDAYAATQPRFDPPQPLTMTVTLEPCSRYGRTPPCVQRIMHYGRQSEFARAHGLYIDTVRIGELDPSLQGGGMEALQRMGFNVERFDHPVSGRPFLLPFLSSLKRSPLYAIKVATDASGIMGHRQKAVSLTGESGRILTMRLRARCDGVLVGPGTTAVDRPSLDLRPPLMGNSVAFHESAMNLQSVQGDARAWFRSLFEPDSGWHMLEEPEGRYDYQPMRIFLLGRPFADREAFLERQNALSSVTGRQPLFLSLRSTSASWPGSVVVPDLDDPAFFRELSDLLIDRGLQRILIEAGYSMLPLWLRNAGKNDVLIHVKRDEAYHASGDGWLRIDTEFRDMDLLDRYSFAPGLSATLYGGQNNGAG